MEQPELGIALDSVAAHFQRQAACLRQEAFGWQHWSGTHQMVRRRVQRWNVERKGAFLLLSDHGRSNIMMNKDPDVHETHDLIASDMVVGTNVYDIGGNHIGKVERLILEKRSGRVTYAVLSFSGFLGIGHDHYPLPWQKLDYDTSLDGFRVDITKEQVEGAPHYSRDQAYDWNADNGRRLYDYYGVAPYWV